MASVLTRQKVAKAMFNRRNAAVLDDPAQAHGPMHAKRILLGVSQAELAAEVGLSAESIRRIERGRPTSWGTRVLLAKALGIPLGDIPGRVKARPPKVAPPKPLPTPTPIPPDLLSGVAEYRRSRGLPPLEDNR